MSDICLKNEHLDWTKMGYLKDIPFLSRRARRDETFTGFPQDVRLFAGLVLKNISLFFHFCVTIDKTYLINIIKKMNDQYLLWDSIRNSNHDPIRFDINMPDSQVLKLMLYSDNINRKFGRMTLTWFNSMWNEIHFYNSVSLYDFYKFVINKQELHTIYTYESISHNYSVQY